MEFCYTNIFSLINNGEKKQASAVLCITKFNLALCVKSEIHLPEVFYCTYVTDEEKGKGLQCDPGLTLAA